MSNDSQVAIGPGMTPEEEADHRRRLADAEAEQAEAAVETIQRKLDGIKESLTAAKAEAKRLRKQATPSGVNEQGGEE